MLGPAYKKLARNYNFTLHEGVAFGKINGFLTTISEGMGYKELFICLSFPEDTVRARVQSAILDSAKQHRIVNFEVSDRFVFVSFLDNPGTMKCIEAFIGWFYPFLTEAGARGVSHCPECGEPLSTEDRVRKLINRRAYLMHRACAQRVTHDLSLHNQASAEEKGNYGRGAVGALIGGMVGAIPWAVVYVMGYFVGLLGLLIGFLAMKGYTLFGGRVKKPTVFILLGVIVFSVLFGQLLGDFISLAQFVLSDEGALFEMSDIPRLFYLILTEDGDYRSSFIYNIVMGLVFAGLGAFSIFQKLSKEIQTKTIVMSDLPGAAPGGKQGGAGLRHRGHPIGTGHPPAS